MLLPAVVVLYYRRNMSASEQGLQALQLYNIKLGRVMFFFHSRHRKTNFTECQHLSDDCTQVAGGEDFQLYCSPVAQKLHII